MSILQNLFINILVFLFLFFQQKDYPLRKNRPTTEGINLYVKENTNAIIAEFQKFIGDTLLLDTEFSTDNLSLYTGYDTLDLAYHFTYENGTDEIIIDNRPIYVAYDINDVAKLKRINLQSTNAFVKTTIMHELCHSYFLQIVLLLKFQNIEVYKAYDFTKMRRVQMYPNFEESFSAQFIEEGICEYVIEKMQLELPKQKIIPKSTNDLMDIDIQKNITYGYSVDYLKSFLDIMGLKYGIMILIRNKPPSSLEILNPDLFFNRLKI